MKRLFLFALVAIGLGAPSGPASTKEGPERVTLEQVLEASPENLANGYLSADYVLSVLGYARGGATVHTPEGTIDSSNVETYRAAFEERRAVYATAIKQRGYRKIAGTYSASATDECKAAGSMLAPLVVAGMAEELTITQELFKLKLTQSFSVKGRDGTIPHDGIIVESVLVVADATAPDFTFLGTVGEDEIELRPWVAHIQATYSRYPPNFPPRPNWELLSECVLTLEKEE